MGTPTIRRQTLEDWDGYREAFESVAAEGRWIGSELPVDWDARRDPWVSATTSDRSCSLVVEDGGRIVGFLRMGLERSGRADLAMGLVDGYRSMGLGTQLLSAAIEWARAAGAHKVDLEVWPGNERALGLYEKHGFVVEARYRRHWRRNDGSLWDAVGMGLVLDETAPGGPPPP